VEPDRVFAGPLTRDECLFHLPRARTGRLAFHARALPMLLPVDYAVDGESIVIRVAGGTQLEAATRDAVVAFQVDGDESTPGWRWSVSVTGMATHITEPTGLERAEALLFGSGADAGSRFVRVSLDVVSGRRVRG
jgi:nitroimidazol reductase NimA-like FMN-containing flavoprotein (pyridoxamine 5'-phosphate oxidase superfamily)